MSSPELAKPTPVTAGATVRITRVQAQSQRACVGKLGVAAFPVGLLKGQTPGPDTTWHVNLTPPVHDADNGVVWHTILEPARHLEVLAPSSRTDGP